MRSSLPEGSGEALSGEYLMKTYTTSGIVLVTVALLAMARTSALAQTISASADEPSSVEGGTRPVDTGQYLIGTDDVLQVFILDVAELSGPYRVDANGKVTVAVLAEPVPAAGLTLAQFSDSLAKNLKAEGFVSDPHVSTTVTQSRLHTVAITGAVKNPQIYPLFSQTTLLDLLSQAQGLEDDAGNTAIVRRGDISMRVLETDNHEPLTPEQREAQRTVSIDLKRLMGSGSSQLNVAIFPGDRVTIPRAGVVYVVGAVNKPGGFTLKSSSHGITVLQAIALAEDTKGTAIRNQTLIFRPDPELPNGYRQIPVQLKEILAGKSPDTVLFADDILFVPDSTVKKAFRRGFDAVVQVTTGVAIYRGR
jgi:polysaccharide export outer membrane protein